MCEYCRTSPCPSGCPNADEPENIGVCIECDRAVYECETRYDIPGIGLYCEDCINEFRILGD